MADFYGRQFFYSLQVCIPKYCTLVVPTSLIYLFKSLLIETFLSYPLFVPCMYLLKSQGHLTYRASHRLDLAHLMVLFSMFSHPVQF